ncbi:DUF305 domain-containing protein [Antrihabitans stalagmiti]|uniref:DUF305 domain-containing protein n=1 Tax=Antrihabitans stalagmiti TaxID=2799499 RepID=UPI0027DC227F|nr:DUF305 domain-containing protein [Antrihabitans stalagmiti]
METERTIPTVEGRRHYLAVTGRSVALLALGIVIVLLAGVVLGLWTQKLLDDQPPSPGSIDIGFAQDMAIHHNQAIEMSAIALSQAVDPAVRTLAFDVLTSQQSQVGTMQGWLVLWNRPTLPVGDSMTWMSEEDHIRQSEAHSMPGMESSTLGSATTMPGMATSDEIRKLRQNSGTAFDAMFLQLLLRHHEGGLAMARYGRDNAVVPAVAQLADSIVRTQTAESDTIRRMLEDKNTVPLPMN